MRKQIQYYLNAALNSYAILFFSQNKIFGALLLLVSLFNLSAGIAGLICLVISLLVVSILGFDKEEIKTGIYSFNSILLGIGFGSFFNFNYAFWFWLISACLLCIVLSVNLTAWLRKYSLPALSIPFVFTFWIVLLAINGYAGMGMMQKSSYVVFELSTNGSTQIGKLAANINLPYYLALFFKSISAVLFQNNVLAGIIISIGFFIHSRIGFSLVLIGFVAACLINQLTGIYPEGISNYHLGANFMMASCAIGGFFLIPSFRSYLWAIVAIPFTFLLVNGLSRFMEVHYLPIFSLPFSLITIGLLYFFMLRKKPGKLQLTTVQNYSPETNLYQFLNQQKRFRDFQYLNLRLPFMGAWTVSQGYDGAITHKNEWGQALDFVIEDLDNKTYELPGMLPENYYCFNKPVLAAADGFVQEIVNHLDDNAIGQINLQQNWGNTIVIKHAEDLYTKVSHLKKDSAKVKVGDYVKQGDIIALCGNSGRSPEPHLHFQVQCTPYIGSKTLAYPIGYFVSAATNELKTFKVPENGEIVQSPDIDVNLKRAFNFQPGYVAKVIKNGGELETWEVFKDDLNCTYFFCHQTQAVAYFVNHNNLFYFTRFYGNTSSALFLFYQAAYKISYSKHGINDIFALNSEMFKPNLWIQDLAAPFLIFIKNTYSNSIISKNDGYVIQSAAVNEVFSNHKPVMDAEIFIADGNIIGFDIQFKSNQIKVKWETNFD
nr:urea transporter [Pedobacter sp. ASV2]